MVVAISTTGVIVSGPWRERVIKGIPTPIKFAAGAGIGLFIAFIGFVNSGIVTLPSTPGGLPSLGTLNTASVVVSWADLERFLATRRNTVRIVQLGTE